MSTHGSQNPLSPSPESKKPILILADICDGTIRDRGHVELPRIVSAVLRLYDSVSVFQVKMFHVGTILHFDTASDLAVHSRVELSRIPRCDSRAEQSRVSLWVGKGVAVRRL